jgi:DNA-binding MarR family transcriptional regulator
VGLVDRTETAGLVSRYRDDDDHRVVRIRLTRAGARKLEKLSTAHLEEIRRLAPDISQLWDGLAPARRPHGLGERPRTAATR